KTSPSNYKSKKKQPRCSSLAFFCWSQPSWLPLFQHLPTTSSPKSKLAKPAPTPKQSHSTTSSVLATDQLNVTPKLKPNLSSTSNEPVTAPRNVKLRLRRSHCTILSVLATARINGRLDLMLSLFSTLRELDMDQRSVKPMLRLRLNQSFTSSGPGTGRRRSVRLRHRWNKG
ncbi:hypothetical protein N431DRAFT_223486, partial [Stipitochalara longipes BDJ]